MSVYSEIHRRSVQDPDTFWMDAASAIDWSVAPSRALDPSASPFDEWFGSGQMNTCFNAVDRHVAAGDGNRVAIIHDSPVTGTVSRVSYAELQDRVVRCAAGLARLGVVKGDRVLIYMPMVPEAVVTMLAAARLGAVHCVVFGGFAAAELASRIDDARPKVIVAASCGLERDRVVEYVPILDRATEIADHRPLASVVLQREQHRANLVASHLDWDDVMTVTADVDCVPLSGRDPLYILYTSGTTGRPKGIVRDNGGHAVALRWSMENVYDARPGDVFWAASDIGWVVGHSYIVYGPLLTGCTTVLYEGKPVGTPDAGAFWRVVADHGVDVMFTAPTAIRAIRGQDPSATLLPSGGLPTLRSLFLAGERLDPETYEWAARTLQVPVVDHWWQTETGWAIASNCLGIEQLPAKAGSPSVPVPGFDVVVLDPDGRPVPEGQEGAIGLRLPLPPGTMKTVWNDDHRFVHGYLSGPEGVFMTGDGGHLDDDGYLYVMGRLDDVINVAGHRMSTGQMEEVVARHPDVVECAVIGVEDALKGEVPRAFVVLSADSRLDRDEAERQVVALIRRDIGAVAALRSVTTVAALPKTRSGKILRRTLRDLAHGVDVEPPATIENPAVIGDLRAAMTPT